MKALPTAASCVEVERADLRGEAAVLGVRLDHDRRVAAADGDHPAPDPLDEREQLRAALLRDDLPQQRAQQAHLAAERVAGAREAQARRLRGDRREPGRPRTRGFRPVGARGAGCHPHKDCRCRGGLPAIHGLRFDCKGTVPVPQRNRFR